ncbi:MAG: NYN domain-containing protein [Candidatus Omnitrophica bacterium]|nr:NYN domain-containing protein [Candidatus Omnitrophota bacterium]MCM8807733.1 NYN domain-containing protein [Candidatus Omnitrophota bacterium]
MEYIIDGLNVIKTSYIKKFEKKSIEGGKEYLIDLLEKYRRKHPKVEITVVFDGYPSSFNIYRKSKIKIIFSHEITADEKIREILESKKNKRNIFVVSDDRQISEFTKILGANIYGVKEFLDMVSPFEIKRIKIPDSKNIPEKVMKLIAKEIEEKYGKNR